MRGAPRPGRALLRWLIGLVLGLFVLIRVDRAGFLMFMGQEPLAYDQLFLLRHLFVLMLDMFSPLVALGVVGGLVARCWSRCSYARCCGRWCCRRPIRRGSACCGRAPAFGRS